MKILNLLKKTKPVVTITVVPQDKGWLATHDMAQTEYIQVTSHYSVHSPAYAVQRLVNDLELKDGQWKVKVEGITYDATHNQQ